MWYIVGLGNPGEEYECTRHNAGKMALDYIWEQNDFDDWKRDTRMKRQVAKGYIADEPAVLLFPETFMNKSGTAVAKYITSAKRAEKLVVLYDEIDLPLGKVKISYGRGSGGHRGIESIIKSIKTKDFIRVRIGVSGSTPSGKIKKPKGEQKVLDFLMGNFKKPEREKLAKFNKIVAGAVETIIKEGRAKAMNECN